MGRNQIHPVLSNVLGTVSAFKWLQGCSRRSLYVYLTYGVYLQVPSVQVSRLFAVLYKAKLLGTT